MDILMRLRIGRYLNEIERKDVCGIRKPKERKNAGNRHQSRNNTNLHINSYRVKHRQSDGDDDKIL